ncbi:hypothetical protein QBC44DRAFT_386914 [Cladorrhinum sp. PSN332]|nr:hypothetical protein QBC44DRAFT_386914 [Cladorrhinum sp. PSN332]
MDLDVQQPYSPHWRLWTFLLNLWHGSILGRFLSYCLTKTYYTLLVNTQPQPQPPHSGQIPLQHITPQTPTPAEAALALLKSSPRGLDFLSLSNSHSSPSWLPNLSSTQTSTSTLQRASLYSASGTRASKQNRITLHSSKMLELHAVEIGTIISLGRDSNTSLVSRVKHWELLALGGSSECSAHTRTDARYQPTGEPLRDAFWRTVFWDTINRTQQQPQQQGRKVRAPADDVSLYKSWWEWMQTASGRHEIESPPERLRATINNEQVMLDLDHSKFARIRGAQKGEVAFGMVPSGARVGDEVWVLIGARVPFVLRDEGGFEWVGWTRRKVFKLLGGGYVHGYMDGEGVQGTETEVRRVSIV